MNPDGGWVSISNFILIQESTTDENGEETKSVEYITKEIHKKDVEFADFRVLKSIDIPSVLVESGFITNPEDAERLKGKPGRRMIARSIFLGVHNYFLENPINGTMIENNNEFLSYKIQKGDVLSEIAIRFGVSVESINENNKLNNKPIYPGQIIKIYI